MGLLLLQRVLWGGLEGEGGGEGNRAGGEGGPRGGEEEWGVGANKGVLLLLLLLLWPGTEGQLKGGV